MYFYWLGKKREIISKMKFGETFTEYLHGDRGIFLQKWSHIEYKRLKKVLKTCRRCKVSGNNWEEEENQLGEDEFTQSTQLYESCPCKC